MMLLGGAMALAGCDKYNYVSDFQQMGGRVEVLEGMELKVNEGAQALHEIIMAVEQEGYVTDVKHHDDGSVSVTFNDGKTFTMRQGVDGRDGRDGRDGKEATLLLGVEKAPDGQFYWKDTETLTFENNGKYTRLFEGEDGHQGEVRKHGSKEEGTYAYDQNTKLLTLTVTGHSYMDQETGKWTAEPLSETWTEKYQVDINGKELTLTNLRDSGSSEQYSTVYKKK